MLGFKNIQQETQFSFESFIVSWFGSNTCIFYVYLILHYQLTPRLIITRKVLQLPKGLQCFLVLILLYFHLNIETYNKCMLRVVNLLVNALN